MLAACGGGGSNSGPPPPPDPPDRNQEFQNQPALSVIKAEYAYERGATGQGVVIGSVDTGVDRNHPEFSGNKLLMPRYASGYSPDFNSCADRDSRGFCIRSFRPPSHGTQVAGVLVANKDGYGIHGIAFNSRLYYEGIMLSSGGTPPEYDTDAIEEIAATRIDDFLAPILARVNSQVSVVNMSFGYTYAISGSSKSHLELNFPKVLEELKQTSTPQAQRTVYVWSAGNAGAQASEISSSPLLIAALPSHFPEIQPHFLTVVALDQSGGIASYSNRCGVAKDFCLAAPGYVRAPVPVVICSSTLSGGCYSTPIDTIGTSFAAPLVAGGFALLKQHFRGDLGNHQIVARLKATANKSGRYSDQDIYGQGVLDLDRATRPLGSTRILTTPSLTGESAPAEESTIQLGSAFGDVIKHRMANNEIVVFDELDAPFFSSFDDYVHQNTASRIGMSDRFNMLGNNGSAYSWSLDGFDLQTRVDNNIFNNNGQSRIGADSQQSFGVLSVQHRADNFDAYFGYRSQPGWQFGLQSKEILPSGTFSEDTAFANPVLSLARNGVIAGFSKPFSHFKKGEYSIAAFSGKQQYGNRRSNPSRTARGALVEFRPSQQANSSYSIQAGWLNEPHSLVGSYASGAFGDIGANSGFLGVTAHRKLNDRWNFLANFHSVLTRTTVRNSGIVPTVSSLRSSAFDLGFIGNSIAKQGDRFGIRLSQPLRIESGQAEFQWVTGRTPDREVEQKKVNIPLDPSGRQLDLEFTYSLPWKKGQADFAAIASHDNGHSAGSEELTVLMRFQRGF